MALPGQDSKFKSYINNNRRKVTDKWSNTGTEMEYGIYIKDAASPLYYLWLFDDAHIQDA